MQTSRNPKVLNKVLKYKLRPVLDKVAQLEDVQHDNTDFTANITSRVEAMKDRATEESDDSALVYDIGNDIFLVGEFNKAKNNVLRCVKIDFFGKTKQYCPKTN